MKSVSHRAFSQCCKIVNFFFKTDKATLRSAQRHHPVRTLQRADDAVLVDSSDIGFEETFALLCEIVVKRFAIQREEEA